MLRPLSPTDLRAIQQLQSRLQSGDRMGALEGYDALPQASQDHPSGLLLRALILQAFGKLPEARQSYEAALALAPGFPAALNGYGNLLDDLGESEAAVAQLQRAVELAPENNDFLINLGIVATNAGRFDVAEDALARAIRAAPGVARAWSSMAHLERRRGNSETAVQLYRRAIEADPEDVRSRHNLATLLREADRREEALAETQAAVASMPLPPETATLHAHLLGDLDRTEEAVKAYRDIVAHAPEAVDAHETLARLLPQLGRGGEALDAYRRALAQQPQSPPLWGSALRSAFAVRDYAQLADWAAQAERAIGPHPEVRIARGAALSRLGDQAQAVAILRSVVADAPDNGSARQHLAHCLVAAGDAKAAEAHALAASRIEPHNQAPWALLTVIWRLLNDTREAWLADYQRLVMPIDLDAAPGFFEELAGRLTELHTTREHPADQSLRGGTQTRGHLFERRDPLIERLTAQIRNGVLNRLRQLPDDPKHPFLSRKSGDIRFSGSWSVRLRSEGFHISHIHQEGWMSSALYVSLPPEVGQGEAGALAFGVPDAALGLDLAPRRIERPQVGRLVIFPSYLWHGTLPFESEHPRLTVAFDAVPA
jgi:tetratricopeptide (TPR) repeat protein